MAEADAALRLGAPGADDGEGLRSGGPIDGVGERRPASGRGDASGGSIQNDGLSPLGSARWTMLEILNLAAAGAELLAEVIKQIKFGERLIERPVCGITVAVVQDGVAAAADTATAPAEFELPKA